MLLKKSSKKLFLPLLRLFVIFVIISSVAYFYAGGFDIELIPGLIIIFLIPGLPTIYLFGEYFYISSIQIVEITNSKIIIHKKNDSTQMVDLVDIDFIKMFKSAGMEKGNFTFQPCEMYYHAEIYTFDKRKIVLTSTVTPGLDEALLMLHSVRMETIRTPYSTIYL